ncbi:hypothetical protein TNCV_2350271 [Trichonephila clavipes]|uniref:Uncharacterized protein n=1 Tax=Trichonephila clavipes TaxID=2585209 RepID=A0A8X6VKM9_TRICX|nr:hypothetical protein TNCV_2350271 [Trichonephila clavipes]
MFDPSSFANPTPLAHADTSRDVLPRGGVILILVLCRGAMHAKSLRAQTSSRGSATLVFGYHFDKAIKRILTHNEINRQMNNSDELSELSEDGLEYSDDVVDFLPDCVSSNEDSDSDSEDT